MLCRYLLVVIFIVFTSHFSCAAEEPKAKGPFTPQEELKTFQLAAGFQIELAASEPQVVDPVAMAFDEHGKLYVAELRIYPNEGRATNPKPISRIVCLEDKNGDGVFETSTVFAEGLRIPNSVMPYQGGLLVCDVPDLLYLQDTNGDGKADKKTVLYTGFDLSNIQMLPNGLQWGLDNWVHVLGGNGGTITCPQKPDWGPMNPRARNFRFQPNVPGAFEYESGGGQFGLVADDAGNWLTSSNANHIRQIVFPEKALARNPFLAIPATTVDISVHGAACKVFRISEFEPWRVERTTRRKNDPKFSTRLPQNELVPGGFATSSCSPIIFQNSVFVCDPANNLIIREQLTRDGAQYKASREADAKAEFLASTDNWFRPCCLAYGPDGSIYVADFYREVIETPLSLPDDIKAKYNLQSRERGRIWRIAPKGQKYAAGKLPGKLSSAELVQELTSANPWRRMTAQRLLMEKPNLEIVPNLLKLAQDKTQPQAAIHALWTLQGYAKLDEAMLLKFFSTQPNTDVKVQLIRLAEPFAARSAAIRKAIVEAGMTSGKTAMFDAALALGVTEAKDETELVDALFRFAQKHGDDAWIASAIVCSSKQGGPALLNKLREAKPTAGSPDLRALIAKLTPVAARANRKGYIEAIVGSIGTNNEIPQEKLLALLEGLGTPMRTIFNEYQTNRTVEEKRAFPTVEARWFELRDAQLRVARDAKATPEKRTAAIRLLTFAEGPWLHDAAKELLQPQQPQAVQLATVAMLSKLSDAKAAELLLAAWPSYSPEVRKLALDALTTRPASAKLLLEAIAAKKVPTAHISPTLSTQLKAYTDPAIRELAKKVLSSSANTNRLKVIENYQPALELKADPMKGRALFRKNCAACHRLENEGNDVGANLVAALGNKTPDALLIDILDPSREVDPRFLQYTINMLDGRVLVGVIAGETASGITFRIAEKGEQVLLRTEIDTLVGSAQSLMPEGLEQQLNQQELADVIAYLMSQRAKK